MSILVFSSDIWTEVTSFTDARDVMKLLLIGNVALTTKLARGVRFVVWHCKPLSRFPFSLFNLPCMHTFGVCLEDTDWYAPLVLLDQSLRPTAVHTALTSISFDFSQSFALLSSSAGAPSIEELLPNLTSLDLTSGLVLTAEHFQNLPRKLRRLSLLSCPLMDLSVSLHMPLSIVESLPRTLETLKLNLVVIGAEEGSKTEILWPPNLTSFDVLYFRHLSHVSTLPRCIEDLRIGIWQCENEEALLASWLPNSLKSLQISIHRWSNFHLRLDIPLPPQLNTLLAPPITYWYRTTQNEAWISMDKGNFSNPLETYFPPTLTECSLSAFMRNRDDLPKLFPNLTSLVPMGFNETLNPKMPKLPSRLRRLSILTVPPYVVDYAAIPPTVTDLQLLLETHAQAEAGIPSTITSLTIPNSRGSSLPLSFWKRISRTLTSLSTRSLRFEPSGFAHLLRFAKLVTLRLQIAPQHALFFDKTTALMKSLKTLSLTFDFDIRGPQSENTRNFLTRIAPSCPSLSNLTLSFLFDNPEAYYDEVSYWDWMSTLPATLDFLKITLPRSIPESVMANFPRQLKTIEMLFKDDDADSRRSGEILDDHFENLPPRLHKLCLSGTRKLTERFFKVIPPDIALIRIYPDFLNNLLFIASNCQEHLLGAMFEYYASPIWQHAHPYATNETLVSTLNK